jgi:hypothetical protein
MNENEGGSTFNTTFFFFSFLDHDVISIYPHCHCPLHPLVLPSFIVRLLDTMENIIAIIIGVTVSSSGTRSSKPNPKI